MKKTVVFILFIGLALSSFAVNYDAKKASVAPKIDGSTNDACWANAYWAPIDQLWVGTATSNPNNYSGRYKVSWDDSLVYIIMEITDDIFHDTHANPLQNYWDDDCIEIFIDEDKSGGNHQFNYNAFAYHVSPFGDIVDYNTTGPALFNQNLYFDLDTNGNVYTWEVAMRIHNLNFNPNNPNASRVNLTANKVMGFSLAYNDSDAKNSRERMYGSQVIEGANKDLSYINADVFGTLTLLNDENPCLKYISINTTEIKKIEAESFCSQFGTTNELCQDTGGGDNVGYLDVNDWLNYPINITSTGEYTFDFRLAAPNSGGILSVLLDDVEIGKVKVDATGGWQKWGNQKFSKIIEAGNHTLKIQVVNGGWNFNYMQIGRSNIVGVFDQIGNQETISVYPNPSETGVYTMNESVKFDVLNLSGTLIFQGEGTKVDLSNYPKGNYLLKIDQHVIRLIK
jgi:hypothetical protein